MDEHTEWKLETKKTERTGKFYKDGIPRPKSKPKRVKTN